MSESGNQLEMLLKQLEREEQALADLREAHNRNGHDGSRTRLRLIMILYRANAAVRLRQQVATIDPGHNMLRRQPTSLPVLDELVERYEHLEREMPKYRLRMSNSIHTHWIPEWRRELAAWEEEFDAIWRDLNARFAAHPRVQQLAASRNRHFGG